MALPWTPISLGVGSNPARDLAAGAARFINCEAVDAGEEGKIKWPVYACQGFTQFGTTFTGLGVSGAPRGMFAFSDTVAYIVVGTRVVRLTSTGSWTLLTGSVSAGGRVTMARNRKDPDAQIGIVTSDGHFYIIQADALSEVPLPEDGGTFGSIASLDGYFLLTNDLGEFYITAIDEGTEIDDLAFAAAESNPDSILRVLTRGRDSIFFGPNSTEFWNDTGATDFPFERTEAASYGIFAAASAVNLMAIIDDELVDTIAWAGTDKLGAYSGIMLLSGYGAKKISPEALDNAILAETDVASIKGFASNRNGRPYYTITGSTFTWEYSTQTGRWHERQSDGLTRWRANDAMTFAGMTIVADYALAKVYWMKTGLYSASASVLTLRHSNDNANSWRATRTKTLSGVSDLKQRVRKYKLGQSKEDGKVFNIAISNAVYEDGTGVSMTVQPPAVHAWPRRMRFWGIAIDTIPGTSQAAGAKGITGLTVQAKALAS